MALGDIFHQHGFLWIVANATGERRKIMADGTFSARIMAS